MSRRPRFVSVGLNTWGLLGAAALLAACAQQGTMPSSSPAPMTGASGSTGTSTTGSSAATASSGMGSMTFFVTSTNPGKGADFGGLTGADAHCQFLATSAGAGQRTWRAYLSTTAQAGGAATHARDRIGRGPWQNAQGVVIARSVDDLHSPSNNLNKQTALTEKGSVVTGRGDPVNMHDILTGSTPDGRAASMAQDTTCGNWTSSTTGSAVVGHHDRMGLSDDPPAKSWNASHLSRGCSMEALRSSGGSGLLYCFASN